MSKFQLSQMSVKKYVHMNEDRVQALDNPGAYKPKDKPTNDYINVIYKMYIDDIKLEMIFSYILKMGFKGTYKMFENQINHII